MSAMAELFESISKETDENDLVPASVIMDRIYNEPELQGEKVYETGKQNEDIIILVLKKSDIHIDDYHGIVTGIRGKAEILSAVYTEKNEMKFVRGADSLSSWRNERIQAKFMLMAKCMIGGIGVYPFKLLWNMTIPKGWRE